MPAPKPITGETLETGGTGNIGWLSSIRNAITRGVSALAADVHAPAAATAAVVTYAAVTGKKHYLYGVTWSYSAAPTGGNLKVEDVSGTTVLTADITAAGPGQLIFDPPIVSSIVNTALIITLASGAGTVVGKLSCRHEAK
jgi:hypothetical protein